MNKKKIIVFGSTGMMGRYVYEYFKRNDQFDVFAVTRDSGVDAKNVSLLKLKSILRSFGADHNTIVINAIGAIPHAGIVESGDYYLINTVFPMMLSKACRYFCAYLVHPTTDCVFSGRHGKYNEEALHDETSDYGLSKSLGENIYATVIRTSIIGETPKGISLVEWVKSNAGNQVNGYTNHYWNGITCLQFAKIVHQMIENDSFWVGIKHIKSPRIVSKYELVELINKHFKLGVTVTPVQKDTLCDRSLESKYDSAFDIPDISYQLQELQEFCLIPQSPM